MEVRSLAVWFDFLFLLPLLVSCQVLLMSLLNHPNSYYLDLVFKYVLPELNQWSPNSCFLSSTNLSKTHRCLSLKTHRCLSYSLWNEVQAFRIWSLHLRQAYFPLLSIPNLLHIGSVVLSTHNVVSFLCLWISSFFHLENPAHIPANSRKSCLSAVSPSSASFWVSLGPFSKVLEVPIHPLPLYLW